MGVALLVLMRMLTVVSVCSVTVWPGINSHKRLISVVPSWIVVDSLRLRVGV